MVGSVGIMNSELGQRRIGGGRGRVVGWTGTDGRNVAIRLVLATPAWILRTGCYTLLLGRGANILPTDFFRKCKSRSGNEVHW